MTALTRTTAPTAEIVSVADMRDHLRLDAEGSPPTHPDDDLIGSLIDAAVQHLDGDCGFLQRALAPQSWAMKMDKFPAYAFSVPLPPLISIDSITYIDTEGVQQTLASSVYDVDTSSQPGVVSLAYGESWPATRWERNAVTVNFTAGYSDGASPVGEAVPEPVKLAIKLLAAHWYENRENVVIGQTAITLPSASEVLLSPFRVWH